MGFGWHLDCSPEPSERSVRMRLLTKIILLSYFLLPTAFAGSTRAASDSVSSAACFGGKFNLHVREILGERLAENHASFYLSVVDTTRGAKLCEEGVKPHSMFSPASSIKTLVAMAALRKVDQGQLSLDQSIEVSRENALADCNYACVRTATVRSLIWDMLTLSSNIAADQLMDLLSKTYINSVARSLGTDEVRLNHKVSNLTNPEGLDRPRNQASSYGLGQLYVELATNRQRFLSKASRTFLLRALREGIYHDSFDASAHFRSSATFYHKPGEVGGVNSSDGGFFYLDSTRTKAVILVGLQDFDDLSTLSQVGALALRLSQTSTITFSPPRPPTLSPRAAPAVVTLLPPQNFGVELLHLPPLPPLPPPAPPAPILLPPENITHPNPLDPKIPAPQSNPTTEFWPR